MRGFAVEHDDVACFHSGGRNYYSNARQLFAGYGLEKNPRLELKEYIYDMSLYMTAADLIICRAGAMTLTELAMMKKPAILIPSPNVTDNHQYKNAKVLADAGAVTLIEESELNSESINKAVEEIYSSKQKREEMSRSIGEFANPDVDSLIYEEISKLIRNRAKITRK